ncbi:MAG: sodium-dependent transporter, partial [Bacteroidales bacterium]
MKKEKFSSKIGVIAAVTGASVGLGNIWKFPYEAGQNGGGIFLITFIICLIFIGIPILTSVFILGRSTGKTPVGAMKQIKPKSFWYLNGYLGMLGAFLLLAFYSVVAGWVLEYMIKSIQGTFIHSNIDAITNEFEKFITDPIAPIIYQFIFLALTAWIICAGVSKGIEKVSFILMPILLLLILFLDIYSFTLSGGKAGFKFLFSFNLIELNFHTLFAAMGQAFFSLSIGLGAMVIYGSYIEKKVNLIQVSNEVAITTLVISMLAGIAIFPAIFAYGISPKAGPSLLFITIPQVFSALQGGSILSFFFFLLLALAGLTSSISILEVLVAFFQQEFKFNRIKSSIVISLLIFILTIIYSLSFGILSNWKILNRSLFENTDILISNIILPLGGLI